MTFSRTQLVAGAAILLVAAALRFYGLTAWSLNNDEIAQVRWSSGSFAEMLGEVRADAVHPPLDYTVQWLLGKANVPEWVRRLPAVIAGLLTIAGVMFLARRWHSPAAGMIAGLLLAVLPIHVRYSQEVRPYAVGIFFVVAALVALESYAVTRRKPWAWLWFASVFCAGATLYLAGMIAALTTLTRIWLSRRDELRPVWRRLPLAIVAWTVLYAPWLGVVFKAARSHAPSPPETLDWSWWEQRLHAFSTGPESIATMTLGSWIFWFAVAGGVRVSRDVPRLRVATAWLIGGSLLTIAILQLRPHFAFTPRYMMPAMIIGVVLAGAGLATWWERPLGRVAASIAIVLVVAYAAPTLGTYYREGRPEWRNVARFVHDRVEPGDKVVLTNNWVARNFGWYWERMPPRDITIQQFYPTGDVLKGPAWIVSGQCRPHAPLQTLELIRRYEKTEEAEVRYLPRDRSLATTAELCPE